MPLVTATSTFGLRRRHKSSPQRCYLHDLYRTHKCKNKFHTHNSINEWHGNNKVLITALRKQETTHAVQIITEETSWMQAGYGPPKNVLKCSLSQSPASQNIHYFLIFGVGWSVMLTALHAVNRSLNNVLFKVNRSLRQAFLQVTDVTDLCSIHGLLHNTPNFIIYRSILMKHTRYIWCSFLW